MRLHGNHAFNGFPWVISTGGLLSAFGPKKQEKKMSAAQLKKCQWRRCYKMISLLHTNENGDFFLYAGLRIVPGNVHECPVLWEMVDEFVSVMGKGVIKDLILDRGFLDGEAKYPQSQDQIRDRCDHRCEA